MTSAIVVRGERFGRNDLIAMRDAQQPFVKAPVTEFAERQSVARVVIVAERPGDDMRGVDRGVDQGANSSTTIAGSSK